MSCDYSNPDSIDLGSLAIGASMKSSPNYGGWSQGTQPNNGASPAEFGGPSPYYPNDSPNNVKPNIDAPTSQFSPPILPQSDPAAYGQQKSPPNPSMLPNSPNGFSPQPPSSFSTMAALGMLRDKTIEKFFISAKSQAPNANTAYAPCSFFNSQAPPANSIAPSLHMPYPTEQSMPVNSPSQNLSPNYMSASGVPYAAPNRGPAPNWPNGYPASQNPVPARMPAVKMEWNEFSGPSMHTAGGHVPNVYYRQSKSYLI